MAMTRTESKSGVEEDNNIYRLWNDCLERVDIPSIGDYAPLGRWQDVAIEMSEARRTDGQPGGRHLKSILAGLTNLKKPTTEEKLLIKILSGMTPQSTIETTEIEVTKDEQLYPPLPEGLAISPDITRNACPLKDAYVAYSREKSPEGFEEFHHTCFWAMASTIAARRIAVDLARKQYTPLLAVLAGRTTLVVKTDTAAVQKDVLSAAGLEWMVFAQTRMTPQALLLDMSGPIPENYGELGFEEQEAVKLQISMSGQRGWHYNEFGKLIKAMMRSNGPMADFVEILLQVSDCPERLSSGTVARGCETIIKSYLSMTGTLTPSSIKAVAGRNAELWSDGFLSRILWSCPPPDLYIDSPFKRGHLPVPPELARGVWAWHDRLGMPEIDIQEITDDKGEKTGRYTKQWIRHLPEKSYGMSDDAYNAWASYRSALKRMTVQFHNTDFDGSYGRLSTMSLRVAALAASIANADKIEYQHWALAQEQAEMWRSSLHQLYAQVNSDATPTAGPTIDDKIIECVGKLEAKQPPTARDVAKWLHTETIKVEPTLRMLAKNGVLEQIPGRQSSRYKLSSGGDE